jgi:flagellar protein FliL
MSSKEASKAADAGAAVAPKKSKKLLFTIIGVALVTLIVGAAAGYMIGHKKAAEAVDEHGNAEAHEEVKKGEPEKPPVFVALEPFTVNLQPDGSGSDQFLQMSVSLQVEDDKKGEELKAMMPRIRHEILSLAAAKKAAEVTSPDGREGLSTEIQDVVNEALGFEPPKRSRRKSKVEEEPEGPIRGVFFTQFIVQ